MKKFVFCLCVALLTTISSEAQQISVVSPSGTTTLYRTLQESIENAIDGSVIYLPGGGFSISDEVKIVKKLTIIGIGHKIKNDNVDGITTINGNLWFNEGSSRSAVMGCYITGDIIIGDGGSLVNNLLIRYCNLNSVQVKNEEISGTYINQNYLRSICNFSNSSCTINNNVIHSIMNVRDGYINYNIICSSRGGRNDDFSLCDIHSSQIYYNIIKGRGLSGNYYGFWDPFRGDNCVSKDNLVVGDYYGKTYGDYPIIIDAQGSDCFVDVRNSYTSWTISSNSNYHFKDEFNQYEKQVGIYGGTGFNDNQITSEPYIIYKDVPEQTDAQGMLKVRIRVKANQ